MPNDFLSDGAGHIFGTSGGGGTLPTVPVPIVGWQRLLIGSGGFVRNMSIAPDGTMIARTDTNGAYLWNGSLWVQLINSNSMPASLVSSTDIANIGVGCFEIVAAPSNTQILYMGYIGKVFVSTNQGGTWTATAFTTDAGGMNPNDSYSQWGQRMAVDPANPNILFVGTENDAMFVTTNGGTSFSAVSGVPAGTPSGNTPGISGICFDPSSAVVGGATQGIYCCSNGNGVYQSTNGGSSWTLTTSGPTGVINATITTAGVYWAVGQSGTNLYSYNGTTWSTNGATHGGNPFQAIAINPLNQSEMMVIDAAGGPNHSANGGSTWTGDIYGNVTISSPDIPWIKNGNLQGGSGTVYYLDVGGAAFHPVNNRQLFISAGTGVWVCQVPATVTSGTALSYVDQSVGIEQMVANSIAIPPGGVPVVASWDRPFFEVSNLNAYPSTYGPVVGSTVEAGWSIDYTTSTPTTLVGLATFNASQACISTNNGASWSLFSSQYSASNGGSIAATAPGSILWAPISTVPAYSTNQGASWTAISVSGISSWSGLGNQYFFKQRCICADRVASNTFYLYFPGKGVYSSADGGVTWTQQKSGYIESNTSLANNNSTLLAVPGNQGHLFYTPGNIGGTTPSAPVTSPMYRSTNGGATWTSVSASVNSVTCFAFGAIAPGQSYPSIVIAGFVSGTYGIWQSNDDAVTWTQLGSNAYPTGSLMLSCCLASDPNNFGTVYVGFPGGGYAYYNPL